MKYHLYLTAFRFEEEILTSQKADDVNGGNSADSKTIIGSGTFDRVQTQLNSQPAREPEVAPVTTSTQKPDSSTTKPRLTFSGVFVLCLLMFSCFVCNTNLQLMPIAHNHFSA